MSNKSKIKPQLDSKSQEYQKIIQKYLKKAQIKILEILTKKYNYDTKTILEIEENIFGSTLRTLRNKYIYDEPIPVSEKNISTRIFDKLDDFKDWYLTVSSIPLYHSLGDTMGYYNGKWEFNYDEPRVGPEFANTLIYEFISLGGINDISIVNWISSDDTIMYMATYKVLSGKIKDIQDFGHKLQTAYIATLPKIEERHGGAITKRSLNIQKNIEWDKLPYSRSDIGAGSCMRSGCIGIFFPGKHNRKKLIALAIESSRITHNSTIAILGSVVSALFTAYAIERVPINHWPHKLLKLLKSNKIDNYMEKSRPNEYKLFREDKILYFGQWENYVNKRFSGLTPRLDLKILKNPVTRIKYLAENFSKGHIDNPGSCGDDAVIMAYDALLESGNILEKLIVYAILHPGDSDTVGAIAMSWFGAFYHSPKNDRLVENKFNKLEYYHEITDATHENFEKMIKIYYYDIYLNTARKIMKRLDVNKK